MELGIAEYGIASWDAEHWGNHRALVCVASSAVAVRVHIPWRRHDRNAQQKGVFVCCAERIVRNCFTPVMQQERVELVFAPEFGPGVYEVYYMVYGGRTRDPYPQIHYLRPCDLADPSWLAGVRNHWEQLPPAQLLRLEACGQLHSFYPMEVAATKAETAALRHRSEGFLLFGEQGEHPIRMRRHLPFRWIQRGPFAPLELKVPCGQFYAFQVGIYAHRYPLQQIAVRLVLDGQSLDAAGISNFTCFQLEGVDCYGQPFAKQLNLPQGQIQALWFGLQAERPGDYCGNLHVSAMQMGDMAGQIQSLSHSLPWRLTVLPEQADSRTTQGDDHSHFERLRWLNSSCGSQPTITKPFQPVRRQGLCLDILGRRVQLAATGLPEQIFSYFCLELTKIGEEPSPMLAGPCDFRLLCAGTKQQWRHGGLKFVQEAENRISWSQCSQGADLIWNLEASLEFDGCLLASCCLEATRAIEIDDILVQIPLRRELVKYRLGLGFEGQASTAPFDWKWDVANKGQDAIWLGRENAGLQVALRDQNYRRPLNTNFYRQQPLLSPSWDNQGKGGVRLQQAEDSHFLLTCYSGLRSMAAGEKLYFIFRLLITPFKPFDPCKQWRNRFYHSFVPPLKARVEGASVLNIHHAQPINPYINYPFLRLEAMKSYIAEAHKLGLKVCLYYTVRELTNHATELFALRSLSSEIFASGPGGGHSWLQEHFEEDYIGAWHVFDYACVAVINSGVSRWHNFYVEGIHWLAKNAGIDGVYIDDLAFDRHVMQRVRRVLDAERTEAIIDMHSANQFNLRDGFANSINLYMEHLPYIDRLWLGEYFHYEKGPDYWMSEVAGLPFGLGGEMLQDGGNLWRGLLYGMTARYPHSKKGDPRPLWKLWREFGIHKSKMLGYWAPSCPVQTSAAQVLVTCYKRKQTALLALASWEEKHCQVRLHFSWPANLAQYQLRAPLLEGIQKERVYQIDQTIPVQPGGGAVLILEPKTLI